MIFAGTHATRVQGFIRRISLMKSSFENIEGFYIAFAVLHAGRVRSDVGESEFFVYCLFLLKSDSVCPEESECR